MHHTLSPSRHTNLKPLTCRHSHNLNHRLAPDDNQTLDNNIVDNDEHEGSATQTARLVRRTRDMCKEYHAHELSNIDILAHESTNVAQEARHYQPICRAGHTKVTSGEHDISKTFTPTMFAALPPVCHPGGTKVLK
jgi:hypothetical protein